MQGTRVAVLTGEGAGAVAVVHVWGPDAITVADASFRPVRGPAGQRIVDRYTRAGFDTELQVRYHPSGRQVGNIPAWLRYVRHVVDTFGPNRRLIAMTITNEINVAVSPNTSGRCGTGAAVLGSATAQSRPGLS